MHTAKDFLVHPCQEHGQVVGLLVSQCMQPQDRGRLASLRVDELVDFAVRVAGDVSQCGVHCRLLIQAMDGHDGEELLNGPRVWGRSENCSPGRQVQARLKECMLLS